VGAALDVTLAAINSERIHGAYISYGSDNRSTSFSDQLMGQRAMIIRPMQFRISFGMVFPETIPAGLRDEMAGTPTTRSTTCNPPSWKLR
jgi:hypothetical protein